LYFINHSVNTVLSQTYYSWSEEEQNDFLDFCSGAKGVKILYDGFFKEIMSPELHPERLDDLLSLLLEQSIHIKKVLPGDSSRIASESSLLIMDILIELEDHSLANIEVQKIGYMFPGERSACYSADLLLRQYKRVRSKKGKKFSYRDIKTVYTIVFFEKSPSEFKKFPHNYIHTSEQIFDTNLNLNLLQKYIFIPLDIFKQNLQNIDIHNKINAWLIFLSVDDPEFIIRLIEHYPEFKSMYEEVYYICQNMERMMDMFSKELQELDRNTVQYMIDEQQDIINEQQLIIRRNELTIDENQKTIEENQKTIEENELIISENRKTIEENQKTIEENELIISENRKTIEENQKTIEENQKTIEENELIISEQNCLQQLVRLLAKEGRTDDILRATDDMSERTKLYKEFNML
jgi:hypothetical protein